jgi:hypothetical protein
MKKDTCTSLYETGDGTVYRCNCPKGHSGDHVSVSTGEFKRWEQEL